MDERMTSRAFVMFVWAAPAVAFAVAALVILTGEADQTGPDVWGIRTLN